MGGHAEDGSTVVDFGWGFPHCSLVPHDPWSLLLHTGLPHAVQRSGSTWSTTESTPAASTTGSRAVQEQGEGKVVHVCKRGGLCEWYVCEGGERIVMVVCVWRENSDNSVCVCVREGDCVNGMCVKDGREL